MAPSKEQPSSPFLPMFETFKTELDEHHDRRERIVKASRDITAAGKKIIFSLQRVRQLGRPIPPSIERANAQHYATIKEKYSSIAADLQGLNTYRYAFSITGGNQEAMEAISFQHYLSTQSLLSPSEAQDRLDTCCEGDEAGRKVRLSEEDYILGVFDMTGELMRFAITAMATGGGLPKAEHIPNKRQKETDDIGQLSGGEAMNVDELEKSKTPPPLQRSVVADLRELRLALETLNVPRDTRLSSNINKYKMGVMQTSVEKVEKAMYGLVVRGSERPKGWMPDMGSAPVEAVESY